jgi:DUF4097 and DUF4098 domain-containing protein YvlB
MGPGSELSVSNVSGRIDVKANEGSEIIVRYRKSGSSRAQENTQVDVHREGNRVTVQTRSGPVGLINFGRASSVNYDIVMPRDCAVRLHSVSGDVLLHGSRAGAGIQTVSGNAQMRDVTGDITITTVSGDVVASELTGTLVARTTSGDGQFLASRLRRFSINTVSGDFVIDTPLIADEHCNAKTVSGDLELMLPPDGGATIQLKSISGSVSCEIPAEIIKSGRRHWQGRVNGGGGNVEMNSVSGDLKIRRNMSQFERQTSWGPKTPEPPRAPRPPEPPRAPVPPKLVSGWPAEQEPDVPTTAAASDAQPSEAQPPQDDGTADILRALEKGEISVEEAMERLG